MTDTTLQRYFNPKRFLYLLRLELFNNLRTLIIILATTLGIVFTVSVFSSGAADFRIYDYLYPIVVLFIGGLIFSSLAFKETHEPGSDLRSLTLPCSRLEKTLAQFVLTAVGWVVLSAAACFLMSIVSLPFGLLFSGKTHGLFNPFNTATLKLIGIYLVVQSVFVFGSLFFRKAAFAKTVLSLIALGLALSLFAALVFAVAHIDLILRGVFEFWNNTGGPFDPALFDTGWCTVLGAVVQALVAPFFWVLTYVRLKEQEVRSV